MQLTTRSPAAVKPAAARPPAHNRRSRIRHLSTILLFVLPSAVLYVVFVFLPVFQAAYYSVYHWNGLGPLVDFSGLKNYIVAFTSGVFLGAIAHSVIIALLSLVFQLPFSLMLALIVGKSLPGRTIFRTIFFMPFILSDVINGIIWSFIYRPDSGINIVLQRLLPGFPAQLWLADPRTVLVSIFVVMLWKFFGFHFVLYVTGLQNIPDEVVEAARIDGASPFQVTRYINIPLLSSTIRLTVLISILGSLQYFDLIWIMSTGGPVHASETMATYLYKYGFQSFEMGYGSAVGVIMFGLCFVFALMYQRFVMSKDVAGSITEASV